MLTDFAGDYDTARGVAIQAFAFLLLFVLGGALYPMYSVGAALAFDRAEGRPLMDISTTILIVNSLGAILGPLVVMVFGAYLGDYGLHAAIILACGGVAITCILGKATRPPAETPTAAVKVMSTDSLDMAEAAAEIVEEQLAEAEPELPPEARANDAVNGG